jgi:hypothetical protein
MVQPPAGSQLTSADLAAKYSAEEIPKQGDHARHKEKVILYAGTGVSVLGALLGLWFALAPPEFPHDQDHGCRLGGCRAGSGQEGVGRLTISAPVKPEVAAP